MKKHLLTGAFAVLTFALVSCSKSKDQLAASDTAPGAQKMARTRESPMDDSWSMIYPAITQPRATDLGKPDSYLITGDQAVFYVVITGDPASSIYTGELTLSDDATDEALATYPMLPHTDPAVAGLDVPEEITQSQQPFMVAIIDIGSQYTGKTIALTSAVRIHSVLGPGTASSDASYSWLGAAFLVQ